jgi:hypothetical protein
MTRLSDKQIQEKIAGVHREVAYHQLSQELGAIPTAAVVESSEQLPLTQALLQVIESKEQ